MAALGLTIALFALWVSLGYSLITTVLPRQDRLQSFLLAPALGLATSLLFVFSLSRLGMPVRVFGPTLLVLLLLADAILLIRNRRPAPPVECLAFVAVFLVGLGLIGRPMLEFGFDWLGYANDDMANYAVGAQFFLESTFARAPDLSSIANGSDYSQYYWYFFVAHAVRPGSELILAWIESFTGLTGDQAFMPLIFSLHLGLISAAAALVWRPQRGCRAGLVAAALVAASALTAFGTLAQLVAQVGGLGLLAACLAIILQTPTAAGWVDRIRIGALSGALGAALMLVYPEVVPFLGVSLLTFAAGYALRHRPHPIQTLAPLVVAGITGIVFLNTYLLDVAVFMAIQLEGGVQASSQTAPVFPYFLVPSGLADLWGFQTIGNAPHEPWLSIGIGAAACLLLMSALIAAVLAWRGEPSAVMSIAMLGLGVLLFARGADFGVFKIAMYLQPFLLGSVAIAVASADRRTVWMIGSSVLVIAAAGVFGQHTYVERGRDPLSPIPNGSQSAILRQFRDLVSALQPQNLVLDTSSITLAKLQATYVRGIDSTFPSRDFFSNFIGRPDSILVPGTYEETKLALDTVERHLIPASFNLHDPTNPAATNDFVINTAGHPFTVDRSCDTFVATTSAESVFNRWGVNDGEIPAFNVLPCSQIRNSLIFVHSSLGQDYYQIGQQSQAIGIFALERDPFLPGHTMSATGRHVLVEVVGSDPTVRVELDMTSTFRANGEDWLPSADAIGDARLAFPLVGRGAARVVSPPIRPQTIEGHTYVAIDMGAEGQQFVQSRTGLMSLWGTNVSLDARRVVAFARDISAISEEQYRDLTPPNEVARFPEDLRNPNLAYSGVYEDGWLSDNAYFDLDQPADAQSIHIVGTLPIVDDPSFTCEASLLIDGQEMAAQTVKPGDFDLGAAISTPPGKHRIELRFSRLQRFKPPDGRLVGPFLKSVRFNSAPLVPPTLGTASGLLLRGGWYPDETFDGRSFRWVNNDAEIAVPPSPLSSHLQVELEPGPGVGDQPLDLQVLDESGNSIAEYTVRGQETLSIPLPPSSIPWAVYRLHVNGGGLPTPTDPRVLNFRVFALNWP